MGAEMTAERELLSYYAEGVKSHSPGSRSAPWVKVAKRNFYPEGVA